MSWESEGFQPETLGSSVLDLRGPLTMGPFVFWVVHLALLCDRGGAAPVPDYALRVLHVGLAGLGGLGPADAVPDGSLQGWRPAWLVHAIDRVDLLIRHGGCPRLILDRLRRAVDSRGHQRYGNFAYTIMLEIEDEIRDTLSTSIPAEMEDDANSWALHTEENLIIEYLEEHYPACMRRLWNHMSQGGLFADHLPGNSSMTHERVYDFNMLRKQNPVLADLVPRAGPKRIPRWLLVRDQWLEEAANRLEVLMAEGWDAEETLARIVSQARLRRDSHYVRELQGLLGRLRRNFEIVRNPGGAHRMWAEQMEDKLFATYQQHTGDDEGDSTARGSGLNNATEENTLGDGRAGAPDGGDTDLASLMDVTRDIPQG